MEWKVGQERRPRGYGVEGHFLAHKEVPCIWLPRRRVHKDVADQRPKAQWEATRGRGKGEYSWKTRVVAIASSWRSVTDQVALPLGPPV